MAPLFAKPAAPKTKLGVYRRLSNLAGVHVSPICLGGLSIGHKWEKMGMGAMSKEDGFKLLDAYFDMGGNWIDTANWYQEESSEETIGEWAETRGNRDQLFLATKYSVSNKYHDDAVAQKVLYGGNNAKSLHLNIEASLKKLRTTYIDLLYVHYWDYTTGVEELMRALHGLVLARKVIYLGISDTPAWVVAKANQYARDHALTPFSVYQCQWNVLDRAVERDIIPMARDEGMALAPFSVLAGGKIRSDEEEERRRQSGEKGRTIVDPSWERNETEKKVCKALEKVAEEVGAKSIGAVAIAYVMHKTRFVFPILGGRKVEQLVANLQALDISLTREHLKFLESIVEFKPGFPHDMIGDGTYNCFITHHSGNLDFWPVPEPITGKAGPPQ